MPAARFALVTGVAAFGWVGSAIVIASGMFVIYREHRLGLKRSRERAAKTPAGPGT